MLIDNFLDDRQPQSCSLRLGRHIRLKDARHDFRRKTRAIIRHPQLDHRTVATGLDADPRILHALLRILGVAQQIMDDLAQL